MVPHEELPVLESLVHIRNRLTALKKDRTEYIRAKDVLDIYASLMNEVNKLNEIRTPTTPKASTSLSASQSERATGDAQEENRVDTILNDVFQLLSLFFLTIGKSRESPATFCQLATMKRLLTHLNESGIYTQADLSPFQARLGELKKIITEGQGFGGAMSLGNERDQAEEEREEGLTKLLLAKWDACDRLLTKLMASLSQLSPELSPLHQRLITLRRLLASIAARARPTPNDTVNILTELRAIDEKRVNGKFVVELSSPAPTTESKTPTQGSPLKRRDEEALNNLHDSDEQDEDDEDAESGEVRMFEPPKGQELLAGLLEDNFEICQEIQAREGAEDVARGPLQPIYDRLSELRAQLERLVLTHRWTLRETDLYNYQMALQEIDGMRVEGKFRDSEGNTPEGQLVLLYLLRRCYGLCYRLMASSEPISEELMPIANKLTTVKRCLIEVQKYGGPYSGRDLYPYQLALAQIDNLRTDGRFQGRDGSVPEGQAILNALLSEAHEIISMMQEEGME